METSSENSKPDRPEAQTPGSLFVVATPIGNLEDISYRALRAIKEADLIFAEDTRHTIRLLNYYSIKKPMISCHDRNEKETADYLVSKLLEGKKAVLVSDAGTPGISDPGEILIKTAINAGVNVSMAPGPTALIMAVVLSGLPTARFCFEGFLPAVRSARKKRLHELAEETRTMVYYEAPHRIKETISDMIVLFGDRECAAARELSKRHEEILRGKLTQILAHFEEQEPRGEFVLVIAGAKISAQEEKERGEWLELDISEHVGMYCNSGVDKMEAVKKAAKDRGITKREAYAALHAGKLELED